MIDFSLSFCPPSHSSYIYIYIYIYILKEKIFLRILLVSVYNEFLPTFLNIYIYIYIYIYTVQKFLL